MFTESYLYFLDSFRLSSVMSVIYVYGISNVFMCKMLPTNQTQYVQQY